ncbi:hypothetical protein MXD59_11650 [Frankia sp. Ag45/Mut15]|uniref:Secreted protein n=1 Tax=Frankia umida TaxID=573489 RepID=A0ABT0JY08_9ACTN|nr:hypothetical protein [Frankia umida]MCK9876419.1 hypothetical protein [Frankia umida]
MPVAGWVLLVTVAVALIVTAALVDRRGGGRVALRRRFGPEYDRAVAELGSRRAAHRHLLAVAERRDTLTLVALTEAERTAFVRRWQGLQSRFVDDPGGITRQADELVSEVMRARGYPQGDVRERAELLGVDHPELAQAYRQAHTDAQAGADTEKLRQALLRLRDLFHRLLGPAPTPPPAAQAASSPGQPKPSSGSDGPKDAQAR